MVTGSRVAMDMPPPPPPVPMAMAAPAMMAQQEDLGDLKLYRIPEPVTVAARSQKQVALLARNGVKAETVYRLSFYAPDPKMLFIQRILTVRNTSAEGLGLPLPAGRLLLFASNGDRPIMLGRSFLGDRAVGEDFEITLGQANSVVAEAVQLSGTPDRAGEWELTVTNAQPSPVRFEALLGGGHLQLGFETPLPRRGGAPLWAVTIPANGRATLRYRLE